MELMGSGSSRLGLAPPPLWGFPWGGGGDKAQPPYGSPPLGAPGYAGSSATPLGQMIAPPTQATPGGLVMDSGECPCISYSDIALPLGGHLALCVKKKIWRGEFIDMFSLLQIKPEPVQCIGEPLCNQEVVR